MHRATGPENLREMPPLQRAYSITAFAPAPSYPSPSPHISEHHTRLLLRPSKALKVHEEKWRTLISPKSKPGLLPHGNLPESNLLPQDSCNGHLTGLQILLSPPSSAQSIFLGHHITPGSVPLRGLPGPSLPTSLGTDTSA